MSKWISRDTQTGKFVIGRRSAEAFSAVEGQRHSVRTGKLTQEADRRGTHGEVRRDEIRTTFAAKK